MAILSLLNTSTGRMRQDSSFWQFLLHHPVVDFGMLVAFGAIVLGNKAMWMMMDAAESDTPRQPEMFSTWTETSPESPNIRRAEAITKYRRKYPDGPLFKMLRLGQVLTVVGFLITIIGGFI